MTGAVKVGSYNILPRINESQSTKGGKEPQGLGAAALAQLEKAYNVFQLSNLGEKLCKFSAAVAGKSGSLKEMGVIFQGGLTMSAIAFVPVAVINAGKAIIAAVKAHSEFPEWPGYFARRVVTALREGSNAISVTGYAAAPFLKTHEKTAEVAGNVFAGAKHAKLIADSCNLIEGGQDLWISRNLSIEAASSENVSPSVKENLNDTFKMNVIKVTKAVCSIAGYVLGAGIVAANVASTPAYAIGVATISLAGSLLGIGATLYATQIKHKQISFFDPKSVEYVPPALPKKLGDDESNKPAFLEKSGSLETDLPGFLVKPEFICENKDLATEIA